MTDCPYCGEKLLGDDKDGRLCAVCGVAWGRDGAIDATIQRPRTGGWPAFPEGALLVRQEQEAG